MSATSTVTSGRHSGAGTAVDARLTFAGVMKGEWIKLASLRSTWWTLGITVVVMTLFSLLQASSVQFMTESPEMAGMVANLHGAELVTSGYQFGMVTIAVLGALAITGEYSTGMIRSTFAAVPSRLPVLVAKTIALVVLSTVTAAVSLVGAHLVAIPMLSSYDLVPALDDPDTWQVYGGMAFFFVASALFALGIGTLMRSTAGTITTVLGVLMLLPIVLGFVNVDWIQDAMKYLPSNAATGFLSVSGTFAGGDRLEPWTGVAVVAAWSVAALVAAAVVLRRRDA
ncbi:ABC transporter permease [Georgenia halophila]|uniref:ABC transporter permease n=1 Tax=Georgenia halophila TaxID=620889 RepID=A0ABP8L5H1_9MICO